MRTAGPRARRANAELPEAEPALRVAVSIGRRLQDPLAELVKLEPEGARRGPAPPRRAARPVAAGGRRRDRGRPRERGVDLNSAPRVFLACVPGLDPAPSPAGGGAPEAHGRFTSRQALAGASRGPHPASFEQAVGFLRVGRGSRRSTTARSTRSGTGARGALGATRQACAGSWGRGGARARGRRGLDPELGPLTPPTCRPLEQAGAGPARAFVPLRFATTFARSTSSSRAWSAPASSRTSRASACSSTWACSRTAWSTCPSSGGAPQASPGASPGDRVEVRVLKVDLAKKQVSLTMRPRPNASRDRRAPHAVGPAGAARPAVAAGETEPQGPPPADRRATRRRRAFAAPDERLARRAARRRGVAGRPTRRLRRKRPPRPSAAPSRAARPSTTLSPCSPTSKKTGKS